MIFSEVNCARHGRKLPESRFFLATSLASHVVRVTTVVDGRLATSLASHVVRVTTVASDVACLKWLFHVR